MYFANTLLFVAQNFFEHIIYLPVLSFFLCPRRVSRSVRTFLPCGTLKDSRKFPLLQMGERFIGIAFVAPAAIVRVFYGKMLAIASNVFELSPVAAVIIRSRGEAVRTTLVTGLFRSHTRGKRRRATNPIGIVSFCLQGSIETSPIPIWMPHF